MVRVYPPAALSQKTGGMTIQIFTAGALAGTKQVVEEMVVVYEIRSGRILPP
jgi:hypothetical protein